MTFSRYLVSDLERSFSALIKANAFMAKSKAVTADRLNSKVLQSLAS